MRTTAKVGVRAIGPFTLGLLAFIHLVLPFTPANAHPEVHIRVGAVLIGSVFLGLAVLAQSRPRRSVAAGFLFFVAVSGVAAWTGRSPVGEGLPAKVLLAIGLGVGFVSAGWGATPKLHDGHEQ